MIRLPNREWAAVGAAELEALGYRAWVADEPGPDGQWPVIVRGTPAQIAALRGEAPDATGEAGGADRPGEQKPALLCPEFDWREFVNGAVGSSEVSSD